MKIHGGLHPHDDITLSIHQSCVIVANRDTGITTIIATTATQDEAELIPLSEENEVRN
jgi:hypothetical protein